MGAALARRIRSVFPATRSSLSPLTRLEETREAGRAFREKMLEGDRVRFYQTIAGPSQRNPDFYNVVPSSEMSAFWLFPGLSPSFRFGPLRFGELVTG